MLDRRDFVKMLALLAAGSSASSTPLRVRLTQGDRVLMGFGLNCFGGLYLWRAAPDGKIVVPSNQAVWEISYLFEENERLITDNEIKMWTEGYFKYLDQNGVRQTLPITTARGVII